jgi:hypothetical protein
VKQSLEGVFSSVNKTLDEQKSKKGPDGAATATSDAAAAASAALELAAKAKDVVDDAMKKK